MSVFVRNRRKVSSIFAVLCAVAMFVTSVSSSPPVRSFALDSTAGIEARGVTVEKSIHKGRTGLRVIEADEAPGYTVAIVKDAQMLDGTIEMELSGAPRAGSPEGSRGFVGVAFRVQVEAGQFEAFYLRPTNGRADDQLRRNHSTQYISHPGYPWQKLRAEFPGVYESYVDVVPAEWTKVRIEVEGRRAVVCERRAAALLDRE